MEGITGGITKEHIDEVVNYVFNQPEPEERVITAWRGCIHSDQLVKMMDTCGDPECPGCSMILKAFQDEVTRQILEYENVFPKATERSKNKLKDIFDFLK